MVFDDRLRTPDRRVVEGSPGNSSPQPLHDALRYYSIGYPPYAPVKLIICPPCDPRVGSTDGILESLLKSLELVDLGVRYNFTCHTRKLTFKEFAEVSHLIAMIIIQGSDPYPNMGNQLEVPLDFELQDRLAHRGCADPQAIRQMLLPDSGSGL